MSGHILRSRIEQACRDGLPAAPAALWDSGQDWTTGTRRLVTDLAHADAAA